MNTQDRKTYVDLCRRVAKIDKDAAQYLITSARELPIFVLSDDLSSCFLWIDTPQGHRYWSNLYKKLVLGAYL
jgi:hypothetical protein